MNIKDDGKIECANMSQGLTYKVKIGEEKITLIKLYNMAHDQRLEQANLSSDVSIEQCSDLSKEHREDRYYNHQHQW